MIWDSQLLNSFKKNWCNEPMIDFNNRSMQSMHSNDDYRFVGVDKNEIE